MHSFWNFATTNTAQPASKIAKLLRHNLISGSTDTTTESGPTLEGAEGMHCHDRDTIFLILVTSFHPDLSQGDKINHLKSPYLNIKTNC